MLTPLLLMQGLLLAQAPVALPAPNVAANPPAPAARLGAAQTSDAEPKTAEPLTQAPAESAAPASVVCSIFTRPYFADRHGLSWVTGTGPGRFNVIDWESRPNGDRLWWLGRWPSTEEIHLHYHIGFNIHWWAGPVRNGADSPPSLPPRVYDLYLDWTWAQRWSENVMSEVRFQPGLFTDFRTTPPDAFRVPGHALGVFRVEPDLFLVAGAQYLQRNDVHVLPVGGILWQPTPSCEFRLVFPEPKIAVELSKSGRLWGYVAAEYGGGRWTYKNDAGKSERIESSDYRLVCGIEWRDDYFKNLPLLSQKAASFLEAGYIFERHLRFAGPQAGYEPEPAWMIRFGTVW